MAGERTGDIKTWDDALKAEVWSPPSALGLGVWAGTYASLSAAVVGLGATPATLSITDAFPSGATVTVPATLALRFMPGGSLTLGSGHVVTILSSAADWPVSQIFSGAGTVKFDENFTLQGVHPEWWGASPAASAAVNTPALQAAIRGAFGSNRTNSSGEWLYNRVLKFSGRYDIDDELECYHMVGFCWESQNKFNSGIRQTATNKRIIDGQSVAYGVFSNLHFSSVAAQGDGIALLDINYDGSQGNDLRPQNITWEECVFAGNGVSLMGVWIARAGGGAQGDNCRFIRCYGSGFTHSVACLGGNNTAPLLNSAYAYNAINVEWTGGDIQGCPLYGLAAYGGNWIAKKISFENQSPNENGVPQQTGYDVHAEGSQLRNVLEDISTESLRFFEGSGIVRNVEARTYPPGLNTLWYSRNSQLGLPGTVGFVGQTISGTGYGGDGKLYRVTDAPTGALGTAHAIEAPFSASVITDNANTYTVNAWVGHWVKVIYPNCVVRYGVVASNTAHTFTLVDPLEFTPGDGPGQACGPNTTYALFTDPGNPFPTFGGLGLIVSARDISGITNANPAVITTTAAHGFVTGQTVTIAGAAGTLGTAVNGRRVVTVLSSTTFSIPVDTTASSAYGGSGATATDINQATGGSGTGGGATLTKTGAGWAVNAFQGYRATILNGAGKRQYGVIASNTSDTLTLDSNGWVTDFVEEALHPNFRIDAADATSQFVIEPDWGTQFTSGDITFELFDYHIITGPNGAAFVGHIENFYAAGGRIKVGPDTTIKNLRAARRDWMDQIFHVLDDAVVIADWHNIYVLRYDQQEYGIPWTTVRNTGMTTWPTPSIRQSGTQADVKSAGDYGGGQNYTDVGWMRGDDQFAGTADKNIFALLTNNRLGMRTARGTNQAGAPLRLQGGLSTGSGAEGAIEFYVNSPGSSGTAVNSAAKTMHLDSAGLHVPVLAFADVGTPADGTLVYVTDGTPGSPLTGGGSGCLAIRAGGVWVGLGGGSSLPSNAMTEDGVAMTEDGTPMVET